MNTHTVAQLLPTRSRRLPVGTEVNAVDLDIAIPVEQLVQLGYLVPIRAKGSKTALEAVPASDPAA